VAEWYGVRVESRRSGPRGNERLLRALAQPDAVHAKQPLGAILVTGDLAGCAYRKFYLASRG
jgi:hypothetical protein